MMEKVAPRPLYGMMFPNFISVSVTPGAYFFCAAAGTIAAAMINPESPSESTSERRSERRKVLKNRVLMKSLSTRCMSFPPRVRARRDGFLSDSFLTVLFWDGTDDSSWRGIPIAAGEQKAICREAACGAAQKWRRQNTLGPSAN